MAQLNAIIEENQRNISDAEGILISINATLSDPYATDEEDLGFTSPEGMSEGGLRF